MQVGHGQMNWDYLKVWINVTFSYTSICFINELQEGWPWKSN